MLISDQHNALRRLHNRVQSGKRLAQGTQRAGYH